MDDRGTDSCSACGQTLATDASVCFDCGSPAPIVGRSTGDQFPPAVVFAVPDGFPPLPPPPPPGAELPPLGSQANDFPADPYQPPPPPAGGALWAGFEAPSPVSAPSSAGLAPASDVPPLPVRKPRLVAPEASAWDAFAQPWQDGQAAAVENPPAAFAAPASPTPDRAIANDPPAPAGLPASDPVIATPSESDHSNRGAAAVRGAAFVSVTEAAAASVASEPRVYRAGGGDQVGVANAPSGPDRFDGFGRQGSPLDPPAPPAPVPAPIPMPDPAPMPTPVPDPSPFPPPAPPTPVPPAPAPPAPAPPFPPPPFPPPPATSVREPSLEPEAWSGPESFGYGAPRDAGSPLEQRLPDRQGYVPAQAPPVSGPPAFAARPATIAPSGPGAAPGRSPGTVYGGSPPVKHEDRERRYSDAFGGGAAAPQHGGHPDAPPHGGPGAAAVGGYLASRSRGYPAPAAGDNHPGAGPAGYPGLGGWGVPHGQTFPAGPSAERSDSLSGHILSQGHDDGQSKSGSTKAAVILTIVIGVLVAVGLGFAFFGKSLLASLFGG